MLALACGGQTIPRGCRAHVPQLELRGTVDSISKSRLPCRPYPVDFRRSGGVKHGYERTRVTNRSTPSFGPPPLEPLHTVRPADQAKGAARKETQHSQQLLPGNAVGHEKSSWP